MNLLQAAEASPRLTLDAETARDLMTSHPVSIQDDAPIKEAVVFLIDKGFSGAPVIDQAGRPVGVLSQTDILVHDRQTADSLKRSPEYYQESDLTPDSGDMLEGGIQVEHADLGRVRDLMTPVVFSVTPDTSARRVVNDMVALKVHRLFVVDEAGVLLGVISALDVLRHLA